MQGPEFPRPRPETIEALRDASSATITTILKRRGITKAWIPLRPLVKGARVIGPALTIRSVPAREDIAAIAYLPGTLFPGHPEDAIEAIRPGDVVVHDGMGLTNEGLFGDLLSLRVKVKGAAALVTDMSVRDSPHIVEHGMPVFSKGTASPPGSVYSVDFNVPISCGGVLVVPGDLVIADDDGVAVVPMALIGDVVEDVVYHEDREEFLRLRLADGAELRGTYPVSPATDEAFRAWRAERRGGTAATPPATTTGSGGAGAADTSLAEQHAVTTPEPVVHDFREVDGNVVVTPEIRARFLRLEPADERPLRVHDGAHQIVVGLDGTCEVEIEGDVVTLSPGQLVHIAPGQRHVVRAVDAPATVYVSLTPHREPTHVFFDDRGDRLPASFGVWRD